MLGFDFLSIFQGIVVYEEIIENLVLNWDFRLVKGSNSDWGFNWVTRVFPVDVIVKSLPTCGTRTNASLG